MSSLLRLLAFDAFFEEVHRRIVAEVIRPFPGMKALDVGCGAGGMSVLLAKALTNGIVVALDLKLEHLRSARDRAERLVSILGDVEKLQFPAGEFDLIWCSRVIHHHLPDPQPALSEMYRVLKPGGQLILRENTHAGIVVEGEGLPADPGLWKRLAIAQHRWFQSKFKHRRPTTEEWLERLNRAGFSTVESREFAYIPAAPAAQLAYVKSFVEGVIEDDRSPEHGDLLSDEDRRAAANLVRHFDSAQPMLLNVIAPTVVCVAVK